MLFAYYGHPVQQSAVVTRYFGAAIPVTGSPLVMKDALNSTWVDDHGRSFQAISRVTDLYSFSELQVTSADVITALVAEQPVYYGDTSHAMILVQADYIDTPGQPTVLAGWVIDPWPTTLGFRELNPNEMNALFLAVTTIRELQAPNAPSISPGGITNAVTYLPELAPQSFGSIFGKYLAPSTGTWDNSIAAGKLPTNLQGTRVLVNNTNAYISFVSPTQINFLMPAMPISGPVVVQVITPAGTATGTVLLKPRSLGVFDASWGSKQYALAQPSTAASSLIGPSSAVPGKTRPAVRGETLQVYATGLGPTTPPAPDGTVIRAPYPVISDLSSVKVSFGGVVVTPAYVGMTYAGLFQINVKVPVNAPGGDILFSLQIGSDFSQSKVYLTIQP
jgi:uncharacterized protein (TIGR03437 family)